MTWSSDMPLRAASPHAPIERLVDRLLRYGRRMPRRQACASVTAMLAAAGLADLLTGDAAWFGPFYLVIIAASTWSLGTRAGIATGIACSAASTFANGLATYPIAGLFVAWNYAMRFLAVSIIVALIGSVRRSYDREWRRARSDGLTGLLNRQGFFEAQLRHQAQSGWSLLAYLDLDGFKQVNDRLGHAAGDTLLRDFADCVQANIRCTDLFARVGGDEFLLLLPVQNEKDAAETAHLLHDRINSLPGGTGCSMGALIRGPLSRCASEWEIRLADQLMYEAKLAGSGLRISTSSGPLPEVPVAAEPDGQRETALAA